ncbi:MAG: hypothetical protein AAF678_13525, partial [Pseudomonadota bacterium]
EPDCAAITPSLAMAALLPTLCKNTPDTDDREPGADRLLWGVTDLDGIGLFLVRPANGSEPIALVKNDELRAQIDRSEFGK